MTQQQPPSGWYPDPSGSGGQKYWDGQQWTGDPVLPSRPSGFSRKTGFLILGVVAALGLVALLGAIGSDDDSSASSPTTTQVFIPKLSASAVAPLPARPASAACIPATSEIVDQVNANLAPTGQTISDVFVVTSPEGYQYVGGNIMEGETKNSSADVWVAQEDFVIYALSGSAREATPQLADGRNLGLSAGDEYGEAVMTCTIQAERARNAAGGN